ncbi:MAG: CDP-glycerol glycerophosphotransferase family protein [Deltaproteobacteria bacterium]|nr:CDP-glycerol glycerophosphotransferase family protein [Deltaproteobacteria bacterium]
MKICFWASTFQADIQAMACHLANKEENEVLVALKNPEQYKQQPVEKILPFKGEIIQRDTFKAWWRLMRFNPDILVVDNHLPHYRPKRMYVLWHGYGWRMDHPERMRRNMSKRVGEVTQPNDRFRWQALGPFDYDFTKGHRGIHKDNLVTLGSPYSDLLRPESLLSKNFNRELMADGYPGIDVVNRPNVLIGMTWHHGGLLGHWGEEWELLDKLLNHINKLGANAILRMHDRKRYDADYLDAITRFCSKRDGVILKFKSESPDSLVDILISDLLITNYSSFANLFYYTLRPSIHIVPPDAGEGLVMRQWSQKGISTELVHNQEGFWKHPPEDMGGLRAFSFDELLQCVDKAVNEKDCCVDIATDYIARHIEQPNGESCERLEQYFKQWIQK